MAQTPFADVALVLDPRDNVAVLKKAVQPGDVLEGLASRLVVRQPIAPGHKIALSEVSQGSPILKNGHAIGIAIAPVQAGEHVHTHNLGFQPQSVDLEFLGEMRPVEGDKHTEERTFHGYLRPDGRVGTRNYVAIVSTVNCSASVCRHIQKHFDTPSFRQDFPAVDGVVAFTHEGGCGHDPGEPQKVLQRVLTGLVNHPNISGCIVIGLGCEVTHLESLQPYCGFSQSQSRSGTAPLFMNIQAFGGTRNTVEAGIKVVNRLVGEANRLSRTPQPLGRLVLAENCGGSDGNSGITANPALGVASDELIRYGGTSVLAETPEICGAEHLLARRATSPAVAERLLSMVRWWEAHARQHNSSLDNNPSPGNKAGGITNILEKSLGALAKGGHSPLRAVYDYAERVSGPGLCFMNTPGYDPVSMTGLVAGGCNIGVFTTGRGSVYGCKPSPCIKISSNTAVYQRMPDDIDINAGEILDGTASLQEVGLRIFEKMIAVASGEKTKSELLGIGDEEFVPWRLGPTF